MKLYEIDGEIHNIDEWCKKYKKSRATIDLRVKNGMSFREALETPVKRPNRKEGFYSVDGVVKHISEWSKISGKSEDFLLRKVQQGFSIKQAMNTNRENEPIESERKLYQPPSEEEKKYWNETPASEIIEKILRR